MTDSQKWLTVVLIAVTCGLIYLLAPILTPFVAGFLLAYLGNPLVDRLCRWRLPRVLAVSIVFAAITLVFLILIGILIPLIRDQIVYLNTKMPDFSKWLNTQAIPWIQKTFQVDLIHFDLQSLTEALNNSWQEAGSMAGQLISKVAQGGLTIVGALGTMALIPVVTFYLMLDWNKLVSSCFQFLPRQLVAPTKKITAEIDEVLGAFFRGQFVVMICLSIVYAVGLKIVGLEIAIIVGLIAGLGSIIPYFGFAIGLVVATIAAIFQFQEFLPLAWVWTVFAIGQVIEGWVLIPYFVGNKVGLHPVTVLFAILAGGQLFGFFGMLLAIPATAAAVVLLKHICSRYYESEFYK